MEKILKITKENFELLFKLVPVAIFTIDKEMRVTTWNKKAEEITGYSAGEMTGKECAVFMEESCRKQCVLSLGAPENPILARECTLKRKDGQLRTVLKSADILRDENGVVLGGIESFEDITERKRLEERLRDSRAELEIRVNVRTAELSKSNELLHQEITRRGKTDEALRQSERFLSNIFFSIQDGISILDRDFNIIRVNQAMEKWYAHAMPLVGKKCYEAYHCRNSICTVCPTAETLKTKDVAYELVPKRGPEGKITGWLDLYSFPHFDQETGELQGVIEYVRDISARKSIEEKIEKLNKELLKSNRILKQLSLTDSHTGLYNHRFLSHIIDSEFHRAKRFATPLTVIMLDIDYFKSINDVYGHQFGDLILKQLARQLKKMVRKYDIVIRFGGEEFIIVSPGIDRTHGVNMAQRLLNALNLYNFGDSEHSVKLKLSLAVVSYPEDSANRGMGLINLVDQILNKAKDSGGDRVYSSLDTKKETIASAAQDQQASDVTVLKGKIDKLTKRANQSIVEAIFAFAKTIELKDHYTGEHVEDTVHYATEIARALNLSKQDIELIRQASILHDLGKIGISENILLKRAKLTKKEFEEIKRHPQIGADIIRPIQFLHKLIPFIFYHHERWDGLGYPSGTKAEEIPLGARIIALADTYQALTSDRPYRKAYSKNQAIKIIKKASGIQFDPKIVSTFLKVLEEDK